MNEGKECYIDPFSGHRVCCQINLSGDEICLEEEKYNLKEDIPWLAYIIAFLSGVFILSIIPLLLTPAF